MRSAISILLCAIVFFVLGYLYSSRALLLNEFVETSSNVVSRTFLERASLYLMLHRGEKNKALEAIESLIYGDLLAMDMIDFNNTANGEILCLKLNDVKNEMDDDVVFANQINELTAKCE